MLIKCPECELQVSDKALSCPHCGYPIIAKTRPAKISTKRRRLPNGFGQISRLSRKGLRKPFRVMLTVGKDELGKPIQKLLKPISYFATYNEAYEALMAYHKDPFQISENITMLELHDRWEKAWNGTKSRLRGLNGAWKYCSEIYSTQVRAIRVRHIKACVENGVVGEKKPTEHVQRNIKAVLRLMLDYAVEYELTDRNHANEVDLTKVTKTDMPTRSWTHKTFSDDEMRDIWNHRDETFYAMVLIQCYTGFRPKELLLLERDKTNINDWTFVGGMKTKSGKNRVVPIHPVIQPLVKKFYTMSESRKYLFSITSYETYHGIFLRKLPNHLPHDPRKHFVTMAKKYKVDDSAIKRIVGHSLKDITEEVYTERSVEWLRQELLKIPMYE